MKNQTCSHQNTLREIQNLPFSIWSKFWKTGRIIDRVQGITLWLIEKFSSGPIKKEGLTINYEHPSSADHFEIKPQAKIYPSDQSLEKRKNNW